MAYTYQHYPLALYRSGVYRAVANEAEEAQAKAEGFTDYITDRFGPTAEPSPIVSIASEPAVLPEPVTEPAKRKPGRPPKAKQ